MDDKADAELPVRREPVGFETDPRQTEVDPRSTIPPLVDAPD